MRSRMKKWPWVDVVAATPAAADSRDVQAELGLSSRTTPLMAHPTLSRWDSTRASARTLRQPQGWVR